VPTYFGAQSVDEGFGGGGGTFVSVGGFGTARGAVARVGLTDGFGLGFADALRLGAAPIDSRPGTAVAAGVGSTGTSPVASSVASTPAATPVGSCGTAASRAHPVTPTATSTAATAADLNRLIRIPRAHPSHWTAAP
jgi:hypothetical protein